MPNPTDGCGGTLGLKNIFVDHIYKGSDTQNSNAWKQTAAISGAHTLGKATIANSGFNGFWSDLSNSGKFNNDYYKSIL